MEELEQLLIVALHHEDHKTRVHAGIKYIDACIKGECSRLILNASCDERLPEEVRKYVGNKVVDIGKKYIDHHIKGNDPYALCGEVLWNKKLSEELRIYAWKRSIDCCFENERCDDLLKIATNKVYEEVVPEEAGVYARKRYVDLYIKKEKYGSLVNMMYDDTELPKEVRKEVRTYIEENLPDIGIKYVEQCANSKEHKPLLRLARNKNRPKEMRITAGINYVDIFIESKPWDHIFTKEAKEQLTDPYITECGRSYRDYLLELSTNHDLPEEVRIHAGKGYVNICAKDGRFCGAGVLIEDILKAAKTDAAPKEARVYAGMKYVDIHAEVKNVEGVIYDDKVPTKVRIYAGIKYIDACVENELYDRIPILERMSKNEWLPREVTAYAKKKLNKCVNNIAVELNSDENPLSEDGLTVKPENKFIKFIRRVSNIINL